MNSINKFNKYISRLFIFGIVLFASCTSPAVTPLPAQLPSQSMTASADGVSWSATTILGVSNSGTIAVEGTKTDGSFMEVILPSTAVGPYTIDGSGATQFIWDRDASTSFHAVSGKVNIKSFTNNVLVGDFDSVSCTGSSGNASITKGSFTATVK